MEFKVEYDAGIFVCTTSGEAEVGVIANLLDAMLADENWKPGIPFVHDLTNLNTGTLTVEDIMRIAKIGAERRTLLGTGKIAIVAKRDLEFGLARMLSAYIADKYDSEMGVFRSRPEAIAWLSD